MMDVRLGVGQLWAHHLHEDFIISFIYNSDK